MKVCLYSPYVPQHTGGGEKYFFDVARILATKHDVVVALPNHILATEYAAIKARYEDFLGVPLTGVEFVASPLGTSANALTKVWWTRQFDIMYYLTDGSLFFSLAGRNILHIQVPLKLHKSSLIERLKLSNWQVKNTNSEFTKSIVAPSWPVTIDLVHQPMVERTLTSVDQKKSPSKSKIILNVGRFFRQLHSKRQDILVQTFRELVAKHPTQTEGWKLVLIGSVEDESYAAEVKQLAQGLPIEILHTVTREELWQWYDRASIYWHAAGFGIDEQAEPEKVEHFGISTVEAMLCGAVPVVVGKGGQREVLGPELTEYLWQTKTECMTKTLELMTKPTVRQQISQQAQAQAHHFGRQLFAQKLWQMVEG